jgi:hypothetical protein
MSDFNLQKFLIENKMTRNSQLVNEDEQEDYDTGGYVETMNPDLSDHVDAIVRIFQEWKNGPMTEPGMEGYAKDDLVDFITGRIRNA